ncbi:MAG: sodium:solute symporter family protein, partial [Myxococcota bacterium]
MPSSAVVLSISVLYLLASLAIGLWPSKQSSDSAAGFVAGDRTLGVVLMYFITGATIFSAFAFLG